MSKMWDQEFIALLNDVRQLAKQAERIADPREFDTVSVLRKELDDQVGEFVVCHDRMAQVLRRKWNVGRAHAATLFWGKQYLTKMKTLTDEFLALQNRKMWLRLLQTRFSGAFGSEKANLEARHLVDLVVRRQHLIHVEQALIADLDAVAGQRTKLREEYERISTADQNWSASVSMHGRLGVNVEDSTENPSTKALRDLFKAISVPLRHPAENAWLTSVSRDLEEKSVSLLDQCKLLAAGYVQKGTESVDSNSLNQFKNAINQVNDLNVQVSKKLERLLSERITPSRPKLVQSGTKQAKTEERIFN